MSTKHIKRYCFGLEELSRLETTDFELQHILKTMQITKEQFLLYLRNGALMLAKGHRDYYKLLTEKYSDYMRDEFRFVRGFENCCAEEQFKKVLQDANANRLLKNWEKWFVPRDHSETLTKGFVKNEIYETYDFERSERAILYIVDQLCLPPMQNQYLTYYLQLKHGRKIEFSTFETDILKMAGRNIVLQEFNVYVLLNKSLS